MWKYIDVVGWWREARQAVRAGGRVTLPFLPLLFPFFYPAVHNAWQQAVGWFVGRSSPPLSAVADFFSSSQSQPHSSRNSQYVEQNLRVLSVVKLTSQPLGRLAGRFMDREGPPCFDRNATGNKTHPSFEPLMRILNIMHPFSFPYFYGRSVFY